MKQLLKSFIAVLCLSMLCVIAVPVCAQAAGQAPAKVKGLTASSGESSVTLKWKRVSNATGYVIYSLNTDTNTLDKVASTKKNTVTIKNLRNGVPYTFCVGAYRTVKSQKYYGSNSAYVTKTPNIKKPDVPKLKIKSCGNQKVTFKWDKIKGANSYELYQKDAEGNFVSIGTTSKTTVVVKNLTNDVNYQFKLRAIRRVNGETRSSDLSAAVTAKPFKITESVSSVHSMYYNAKVKRTLKAKCIGNKSKTVTVKSGTSVTVTKKTSGNCSVKLKNGTEVYIPASSLNIQSFQLSSSKDYSTETKEGYVNHKGYRSDTGYLIWISLYKQRFHIFKGSQGNWTLFKTYKCSTGRLRTWKDGELLNTATSPGTYKLWRKTPKAFFDSSTYAIYCCNYSGNMIHSWTYHTNPNGKDPLTGPGPKKGLGKPASAGCVRLATENARYVYEKIPMNTTIIIY